MKTNHVTGSNSTTTNTRDRKAPIALVAIDPGIANLGLATFEGRKLTDYTVKTIPQRPLVRSRLLLLQEILERYLDEKHPSKIALEKTNFSSSTHNGLLVLVYYKILAIARHKRIEVSEYSPITVRKAVCGNGHATKRDVMKILVSRYPELRVFSGSDRRYKERHFYNLFDAVAVGLAHLKRRS
ncbi:putative Crossover junction endodeoxyribonuclease RuvC [Candidatus Zixiibacteriota bacterium]|nr:putative Crossover junction endodeoxyribonuclease RuvC [candidate division Zixibacteria bacterium]